MGLDNLIYNLCYPFKLYFITIMTPTIIYLNYHYISTPRSQLSTKLLSYKLIQLLLGTSSLPIIVLK